MRAVWAATLTIAPPVERGLRDLDSSSVSSIGCSE
jgi:hypothetical protein